MKSIILILESNIQAADLIALELSREGHYLIRAHNGQDGMRLLRTRKPDVVLIDLPERMEPDSFDIFFQMQEDGLDTSPLTFVNESEVDLAESFKMDYIVKPFSIHDLKERLYSFSVLGAAATRRSSVICCIKRIGRSASPAPPHPVPVCDSVCATPVADRLAP